MIASARLPAHASRLTAWVRDEDPPKAEFCNKAIHLSWKKKIRTEAVAESLKNWIIYLSVKCHDFKASCILTSQEILFGRLDRILVAR